MKPAHLTLILFGLALGVACAPAQAQIAFRGAGTTASGTCCDKTPGLPPGWQPNDIHLLIVETKDNVVSSAPAGWTLLNAANSGTAHRASLWWRRAAAGDTDPLVSHPNGGQIITKVIGFSGVDTTTAFDGANSFTASAADFTTEAGAITTVTPNAMLVFVAMMASAHTDLGTPTGSAPWTKAFSDWTNSNTGASIGAYYGLRSGAGAQAAVTATSFGGASAVSHGVQLALRPGDTSPPSAPPNLSASAAGATQINLAWSAPTDNFGVTGYRVERCQATGCGNFVQIGTPTATSFNDTGLTAATSYSYRVRATDAAGNLSAYSNVASATTAGAQVAMYFIHPDHLNTPRMIANQAGTTVWRWDNTEPFGNSLPNDDPDGDGVPFVFDLRFPGQYFDRETNLAYNWMRDYDSALGRYVQSDPIGLLGGLNLFAYAYSKPTKKTDPSGLLSGADAALGSHFYTGGGSYLDISRWCDDYKSDPSIIQRRHAIEEQIKRKTESLAGALANGQSVPYTQRNQNWNYLTNIYSFGAGNIHIQFADCTITGTGGGCCATANCNIMFTALDRFDDPLDLCQRYGICSEARNLGGTTFWFGLRCDEGFSYTACKK